ncbi:M14 family metallopeptidase [Caldimonas brevitalea]|uniref:DUF2817 domain-containing protein n=1 Tax=Caldimonas brevitalea TaxID=413882 RepID=A0A0G3BGH2_9BURK|nr:M14 family metallopeptidase [Caldimonas brevitalea]AKJ27073.1 hypothetical protein AAW51_0382 [Caldimonas brevitalea]
MMSSPAESQISTAAFSQSYVEARNKFLVAAQAAGLEVRSYVHPLQGRDGETLAMDVARFGPDDASSMLLLSSGTHGVEGFCGSGVQVALLSDPAFHRAADAAGVAVLYIHALNPYGFSWWRRTTHENVDLNRNFHDFSQPLPTNPGYDEIAHALVLPHWPPKPEDEAVLQAYVARHGYKGLQQAVTGGQYKHPQGLYYGGTSPTWSNQTLRYVLQHHGQRCNRLGWIDLHSGLGPNGVGERIFFGPEDGSAVARARAWWGPQVTAIHEGGASAARLEGLMYKCACEECPQAEYTGIVLEFGTVSWDETTQAMRGEQWLENHPEIGAPYAQAIKQRLRDAFYTDTVAWKQAVLAQAAEASVQALQGLAQR